MRVVKIFLYLFIFIISCSGCGVDNINSEDSIIYKNINDSYLCTPINIPHNEDLEIFSYNIITSLNTISDKTEKDAYNTILTTTLATIAAEFKDKTSDSINVSRYDLKKQAWSSLLELAKTSMSQNGKFNIFELLKICMFISSHYKNRFERIKRYIPFGTVPPYFKYESNIGE